MSNESEAEAEAETAQDEEHEESAETEAETVAEDADAETEKEDADADADSEEEESGANADADEAEDEDETEDGGLQDGDFVRFEYTARTVEDGRLVDTTDPDVAAEEDVDQDPEEFGPRTIVLGEGHVFGSIEDDIRGREVGESGTVTVPASEAFGEFDEDQVRTVSKDKIPEDDRYPGAQVQIDGDQGFVETIIGGRARVDFNHPLAGDDIEYEYELLGTVEDREEKAHGLLEMFLGLDLNIWFQTDTVEEEQLVEDEVDEDNGEADAEAEDEEDEDDETEAEDEEDEDDETEAEGEEDDEAEDDEPTYETVEVEKESLYIEATPQLTMNQQWMFQKQQIGENLVDLVDVDRVVIQEIIEPTPMGMPGMMGGMGGGAAGLEEALEEADIDAEDLAEELE